MKRFWGTFACSALLAVCATALPNISSAQSLQGSLATDAASNFARDRNIAVRQRPHPGYESPAHSLGAFAVAPTVTAVGEYNDNIYGSSNVKADDAIAHVTSRVDIQSNWSRNALGAFAQATINKYSKYTTEDTTDYLFGANGRLDALRFSNISAGIDHGRLTEPRTSSSTQFASLKPIRFYQTDAYVAGVHEVNRIRLSSRYDWRKFNYIDGRASTGRVVDEDDRDRNVQTLLGRVDYAVSPATAVFFQLSGNWRDYRLKKPAVTLTRDSDGYEALVGANFELSNVMRGELGVGYLSQSFKDSAFRGIHAFGARGQVEWFPTQLTTITATASRTIEDSGLVGSSGYLSTNIGLQVDHELLRNVILGASGGYGWDGYRGIARDDHRLNLGVSGTYLMNRRVSLTAAYNYFDQTSKGLAKGFDFTVNRVTLSLNGRF